MTRVWRWRDGLERPIAPDPVSSPPYTYGLDVDAYSEADDVFKMDGIAQATHEGLARLFSGHSKEREPINQWFVTQLQLYGIPCKKTARKSDLKEALKQAFNAGKCNELAPLVAAVRDRLKEQYDDAFKRLEDKMFAEIKGGHAEEANSDPPRFVAKYFLDAQGRPDREKTRIPLSFALCNNQEEFDRVIKAVPGLAILRTPQTVLVGWEPTMQRGIEDEFTRLESVLKKREDVQSAQANVDLKTFLRKYLAIDTDGSPIPTVPRPSAPVSLSRWSLHDKELPKHIVSKTSGLHIKVVEEINIIGWDAAQVDAEVTRLEDVGQRERERYQAEEKAERAKQENEKKERWERRCKPYYDLLAKQQQRPSPLSIQHLPGAYLLKWHGGEDYGDPSDPYYDSDLLKLNVFPPTSTHGVKASFCFGVVEGTMLLGMSKRAVKMLREEQPKDSESSEEEESDRDVDEQTIATLHRGVSDGTETSGTKRSLGTIADPYGVQAARAKRQKPEPSPHPNRVYFQFVCNDVNGYPNVDDNNANVGHFDFDETGLAAKGVYRLPLWFGEDVLSISIFKLSERPEAGKEPKDWYMFDGRSWGNPWSSWK